MSNSTERKADTAARSAVAARAAMTSGRQQALELARNQIAIHACSRFQVPNQTLLARTVIEMDAEINRLRAARKPTLLQRIWKFLGGST